MATGPAKPITAPLLITPTSGLLRAATVIDHEELHWGSAIEWSPENCGAANVFDPCSTNSLGTGANHPATIRFEAFAVHAYDQCSAFGFLAAEYGARVRRAIAAHEGAAVEREWWNGTLWTNNPHLAKTGGTNGPNAITLAGGAAQSLRIGLALLVQAVADSNASVGMIHCRPFLAELWYGLGLLFRDTVGRLWTGTGHPIVAGYGYPGTSPTGGAITATSEWAFVTDEVVVHRGPVDVPSENVNAETLDRTTNTVVNRAERVYALAYNGCVHAAVQVNPTLTA